MEYSGKADLSIHFWGRDRLMAINDANIQLSMSSDGRPSLTLWVTFDSTIHAIDFSISGEKYRLDDVASVSVPGVQTLTGNLKKLSV